MDTYSIMREFADSWGLVMIFGVFIFAVFWALRPGSSTLHNDAALVPFRHEEDPEPDTDDTPAPDVAVSGPKEGNHE